MVTLVAALLGTLLPGGGPVSAQTADRIIFDDAFAVGFSHNQWWGANNIASTSPVKVGTKSISTKPDAYAGIAINIVDGVRLQDYASLRLWVNGGAAGSSDFSVAAKKDTSVDVGQAQSFPAVAANTWVPVTVPLSALLGSATAFDGNVARSLWFISDGTSRPTIYLDQIELVNGTAPATTTTTTTVAPNGSVSVLNAGVVSSGWTSGGSVVGTLGGGVLTFLSPSWVAFGKVPDQTGTFATLSLSMVTSLPTWDVQMYSGNTALATTTVTLPGADASGNRNASVPMSSLNPSNLPITNIYVRPSGAATNVSFKNIALNTGAPPATTTTAPAVTTTTLPSGGQVAVVSGGVTGSGWSSNGSVSGAVAGGALSFAAPSWVAFSKSPDQTGTFGSLRLAMLSSLSTSEVQISSNGSLLPTAVMALGAPMVLACGGDDHLTWPQRDSLLPLKREAARHQPGSLMSDIATKTRTPRFRCLSMVLVLILLFASCSKSETEFDWRLVSNVEKGIQAPWTGYYEWATERSWYAGLYGDASETCKEQVSRTETIVCLPKFAGAFKTQNGPVAVSDIVKAFQSRMGFLEGFHLDLRNGKFGYPNSSQFNYKSTRFYLVSYQGGYKCERALVWQRMPTGRAATFCDKDVYYVLLTDVGLIADFFPLTVASARFSSQIVASSPV